MKLLPFVLVPVCLLSISACVGGDDGASIKKGADVPLELKVVDGDVEVAEDASGVIPFEVAENGEADEYAFAIDKKPTHGKIAIVGGKYVYTPAADYNGPDTIEYSTNRGEQKSNTGTVSITVTPVNDLPAFTGKNILSDEDAGSLSLAFATGIAAGPANESTQALVFSVSSDNGAFFSTQPAVNAATGNISFATANNVNGVANLTVTLSDGIDAVSHTYTLTVLAGSDAPTLTSATLASIGTPAYGVGATFYVSALTGLADADAGSTLSVFYQWRLNGAAISGQTGRVLPAGLALEGEEVSVDVTPFDGALSGAVVSAGPVTVANTPPTLTSATMASVGAPDYGVAATFYVDSWSGLADADATDPLSVRYQWYLNGSPMVGQTNRVLPAGLIVEADQVRVDVIAFDGTVEGSVVTAGPVAVVNTPPTLTSVGFGAGPFYRTSTLTAAGQGAADADAADSVSVQYRWHINGVAGSTAASIATGFAQGDTVTVSARSFDGTAHSDWIIASTATIQNRMPAVSSLGITPVPSPAIEASVITAAVTSADADGDTLSHAYAWYVNGSATAVTGASITGADFAEGDTVAVLVTPNDAIANGAPAWSATITIGNSTPTLTSATIASLGSTPYGVGATFYVDSWTALADADAADTASLRYQWRLNGNPIIGQTARTLPAGQGVKGDQISVDVIPYDGTVEGVLVLAGPAAIVNTPPTIASIGLGAGPFYAGVPILPSVGVASDADADTGLVVDYLWFVNGVSVSTSATISTGYSQGDTVAVSVRAADSTEFGPYILSAPVTISNTKPVMDSLTLVDVPSPATRVSTLSYVATSHDADANTVIVDQRDWFINGSPSGIATATLTGASFQKGDVVMLRVTPFDGIETGTAIFSNAVTIQNAVPVPAGVTMLPAIYEVGNALSVTITPITLDPDGETITYTYQWLRNDVDQGFPTNQTVVPGELVQETDVWKVVVTASDGVSSATASATKNITPWMAVDIADIDLPEARTEHKAVWTGSEMIVYGGRNFVNSMIQSGGRYDPATNSWRPTSNGVSQGGMGITAIWTGREMIVWGGVTGSFQPTFTGGKYNPATDSWVATDVVSANKPSARWYHSAVWTGREMIVWGGAYANNTYLNTGGRYEPVLNTWTATDVADPDLAGARTEHTAVWSGKEMIVWGGVGAGILVTGGRYDPVADSWQPTDTSDPDLPGYRQNHQAIWTGSEMIVWGGSNGPTGGRYDPNTNTWRAMSGTGVPEARSFHSVVWTGREMIVWGGLNCCNAKVDSGARYDPVADTWTATPLPFSATQRYGHTAVWSGREMIVWGGLNASNAKLNTGWRYTPPFAVESTGVTAIDASTPTLREGAISEWTGSEMLIWSGWQNSGGCGTYYTDGARYNPALDSWQPITSTGAPLGRTGGSGHHYSAHAWTGSQMLVWGGYNSCQGTPNLTAGGAYNPATNAWEAFSTTGGTGEPTARYGVSSVWTGSEMIVWGGTVSGGIRQNNGKAYNPSAQTWRTMTDAASIAGIEQSPAVWTGKEMITWGGYPLGVNLGLRYDPVADSWSATSVSPLSNRYHHGAVWTGNEMVVVGGSNTSVLYDDAARYFPGTNTWSALPASGLPVLELPAIAWTGREVIVSDGNRGTGAANSIVAYTPRSNTWDTMAVSGYSRSAPSYDWTGKNLIIWGGEANGVQLDTGFMITR